MINYTWKILELFADCKGVKYYISATDSKNTVETEGNHSFSEGIVNKEFSQIVEADLIGWLNQEHAEDGPVKTNLLNQLKALEVNQKVEFPWLANTFTVE